MSVSITDISSCASEPIRIPGAIQPHGVLICLSGADLSIVQLSNNTQQSLGISSDELLGRSFLDLLDIHDAESLRAKLVARDGQILNPLRLRLALKDGPLACDAVVHDIDGFTVLELEALTREGDSSYASFYTSTQIFLHELAKAEGVETLCRLAVREVRRITGFSRVMLYRFDAEWNGQVVAEDLEPGMTSYAGLHFPASDIPAQARALYAANPLRLIVDVDYKPVPLTAAPRGQPLDMSYSTLRSVSPIHLEYLRNMRVKASMSISVLRNGRLWGLFACHHSEPRFVAYQDRFTCQLLSQHFSLQLQSLENRERQASAAQLQEKIKEIRDILSGTSIDQAYDRVAKPILDLARAKGAAICLGTDIHTFGMTPTQQQIRELLQWLTTGQPRSTDGVYASERLTAEYPPARAFVERGAGLLALSPAKSGEASPYVLWFRPEVIASVTWAGDPEKVGGSPGPRDELRPRKSFERWKQSVREHSHPWLPEEREAALELRSLIAAEELLRLNRELANSNRELDAFSSIVSHDLKEPVRGIRSYAMFIQEDDGPSLSKESTSRLEAILRLSRRIDSLIDALFDHSRLGRVGLSFRMTNLNDVAHDAAQRLQPFLEQRKARLDVASDLPTVFCDGVRIGEVFYNLILNAVKYNDKDAKRVVVGCAWDDEKGCPVFTVSDNGIGIDPEHFKSIFTMFRRLHEPEGYGGGTGAGLSITKRIIESHGGQIWLRSEAGVGTTFYFTLVRQGERTHLLPG